MDKTGSFNVETKKLPIALISVPNLVPLPKLKFMFALLNTKRKRMVYIKLLILDCYRTLSCAPNTTISTHAKKNHLNKKEVSLNSSKDIVTCQIYSILSSPTLLFSCNGTLSLKGRPIFQKTWFCLPKNSFTPNFLITLICIK